MGEEADISGLSASALAAVRLWEGLSMFVGRDK